MAIDPKTIEHHLDNVLTRTSISGWFADVAHRVLRSNWFGPNGARNLSREVFEMMQHQPSVINGPIRIVARGDTPAVTIVQETTTNTSPLVTTIINPESPNYVPPTEEEPAPGAAPPAGDGSTLKVGVHVVRTDFAGTVASNSGSSVTINLIDHVRSGDPRTPSAEEKITATIPQLAADETIPAGTFLNPVSRLQTLIVTTSGGQTTTTVASETWKAQPPVWL